MAKPKLIVFAGKPAVGKSAVIERIKDSYTLVDVWPFLVPYVDPATGVPPEEKNILGYQDMYQHLAGLGARDVILEIGTNYPEFNINEIAKLANAYRIHLFLCDASVEVIRERGKKRGYRYNPSFEVRLMRDFPNSHVRELAKTAVSYEVLPMEGDLEQTIAQVKSRLASIL